MSSNRSGAFILVWLLFFTCNLSGQDIPKTPVILNPAQNLSVTTLPDQLLFTDLQNGELMYTLNLPGYGSSGYLTFSPDGSLLLSSGNDQMTRVYQVKDDACQGLVQLPAKTEAAVFDRSGHKLFLLHSRSFWGARVSVYDTRSWELKASVRVPAATNALSLNQDASLIGLSAGTVIRVLDAGDLSTKRVYWERDKQRNLVFNPVSAKQCASVSDKNIIQVRDLEQDTVLVEIAGKMPAGVNPAGEATPQGGAGRESRYGRGKAGGPGIRWLGWHPSGELLGSLDAIGVLSVWSPAGRKRVLRLENVRGTPAFDADGKLHALTVNPTGGGNPAKAGLSGDSLQRQSPDFAGDQPVVVVIDPDSVKETAPADQSRFLEKTPERLKIFPQPVIAYKPETGVLLGAGATMLFPGRASGRPSLIAPVVTYGLKGRQLQTGVNADLFLVKGWRFVNQAAWLNHGTNYFFGIGGDFHRDERRSYTANTFSLDGSAFRRIGTAFFAGINYRVRHDTRAVFETGHIPVPGSEGGWLTGIGPAFQFDDRDDVLFPLSGNLLDLGFYRNSRGLGSDYQYNELRLDYRRYQTVNLIREGSVLAFQGLFNATWGGEPPFYRLPYITADRTLRGVWRNLYIDKQVWSLQTEFRSFIAPGDTRWGYVVFAGLADGAQNLFRDYHPDIKAVFGAGWRQQVIPKQRLDTRLDFAFTSKGDFGISGGIGIAF